jgi:hypothetical protein
VKDLIQVLFDNLDKWQEKAVGPNYGRKAEEGRLGFQNTSQTLF